MSVQVILLEQTLQYFLIQDPPVLFFSGPFFQRVQYINVWVYQNAGIIQGRVLYEELW